MPNRHILQTISLLFLFILMGSLGFSQSATKPQPNFTNLVYGTHERNKLDIWLADTTKVTPLAIYIHGGGFVQGSKDGLNGQVVQDLLDAGISVAAINYRFLSQAPLPGAHYDALRALQFIRHHAEAWKIDKVKIAAFGGSAGAQLSMWLAFSDEMADPTSTDPIERESSRLYCVASKGGQTTMDMNLWRAWIPGYQREYSTRERLYGDLTEDGYRQIMDKLSSISIVSSDDPPIFMRYRMPPEEAIPSHPRSVNGWQIHHVIFGIKLKKKMDELGVEADLQYPGAMSKYESRLAFLRAQLLGED